MKLQELHKIFLLHPQISIDSRIPAEGAIFFALRGDRFNGNEFAGKALENGCSYAVIDDAEFALDERYIVVDDALTCLQQLATLHRDQFDFPVLGITGTNGKTTTKELVSRVLREKYATLYTQGNLNNQIGVPLTLLSFSPKSEIAIVEMGANHLGEIADLCRMAKPTHGLITNIGVAHIEGFGSKENIRKAKAELFDHLDNTGGVIFYDENNEILKNLVTGRKIEIIPYGNPETYIAGVVQIKDTGSLRINLVFNGKKFVVSTNLAGEYNASNVMAALRIGDYFQVEIERMVNAIESYLPDNNRSQIIKTSKNLVVMDAYNANPTSMDLAINNFMSAYGEGRLLILGDMLELGFIAEEEHDRIITKLNKMGAPDTILVGEVFCKIAAGGKYPTFRKVEELIEWLKDNPVKSRNILVKGSRGITLEKVLDSL